MGQNLPNVNQNKKTNAKSVLMAQNSRNRRCSDNGAFNAENWLSPNLITSCLFLCQRFFKFLCEEFWVGESRSTLPNTDTKTKKTSKRMSSLFCFCITKKISLLLVKQIPNCAAKFYICGPKGFPFLVSRVCGYIPNDLFILPTGKQHRGKRPADRYVNMRDLTCAHWLIAMCKKILSNKWRNSENHDTVTTLIPYYFLPITLPKTLHISK